MDKTTLEKLKKDIEYKGYCNCTQWEKRMTEQEQKEMLILTDTLEGEINRMCVTKDLSELDTMALHAKKNIERLQAMRYKDFNAERRA